MTIYFPSPSATENLLVQVVNSLNELTASVQLANLIESAEAQKNEIADAALKLEHLENQLRMRMGVGPSVFSDTNSP